MNLFRLSSVLFALVTACSHAHAAEPVRGVWVAGPQHNPFWSSRDAIRAELKTFKAAGLNSVYAVMLLPGRTLYPSARMAQITGVRQLESLGERDVMQELLEEAEPLGLRVIAWLEFGFASHFRPGQQPGLLQFKPEWTARQRDGKPVVKNGFHWMNAFDPEVQQLLIDLSVELLQRYPKLTGVQGDDRLPALPASAGYHPAVLQEFGWRPGQPLPADQDPAWLQWRADQLTAFLARFRAALKAVRTDAVLSLSPSPYPWALHEYLQDWPAWMRAGLVDELLPQLYRRDGASYERLLAETKAHIPEGQQQRVFPGLLLALGPNTIPSPSLLQQWLTANRTAGFAGEVLFHSTGVADRAAVLKQAYKP
ncbi:glycoside hydrolase family 10 protein [Inhella gelatinilytica]|uniref:Family 10 glycosylhydrolase n=1 Tax=Inhella gelatinilytica TaxID=2795030 RepID=A0A931ITR2_9BURK|nr:family 10 glycosylhydrolase [Inhella gelatinilytica]MBH9552607.1 family 10 glycosylhydrolase [Inhella gelatinilytica]